MGINKKRNLPRSLRLEQSLSQKSRKQTKNSMTVIKRDEGIKKGVTTVRSHREAKKCEDQKQSIGFVHEGTTSDFVRAL